MFKNQVKFSTKIITVVSFIIMVSTNAMATLLPLNGVDTGSISDAYFNLFAPAGITFAIWGVIYLLLFIFVLYVVGVFNRDRYNINVEVINRIALIFSFSSIANSLWLFAWHWEKFLISIFIMLTMLGSLILINLVTSREELTLKEKILVRLPFSVYFGWITIATIANVTTYLVSINWTGFNLSEVLWTVVIIIVGMLIGLVTTLINKDIAYALVFVWAYGGILLKHFSTAGFYGQYPAVIVATLLALIGFVLSIMYLLFFDKEAVSIK